MIANLWDDAAAIAMQDAAGPDAYAREVALRVYTSRLLGQNPDLVMHGGGNTSVKLVARDVFGEAVDVLHIKGSGWDLEVIEAAGLPAVRIAPLMRLRSLERLSDEDMVNVQRANLMDSAAPNPSVETLLHAYLPHKYVDHTHATPFLALANLPEVHAATREIFGDRMAVVPYIMPGFALAVAAAEVAEAHPAAEGLLLRNHGHFTWGPTAKASYDRVISHTNEVEAWLAQRRPGRLHPVTLPKVEASVLPMLRGAIARHLGPDDPMPVFDLRGGAGVDSFLARPDLAVLAARGVATPDHVIRTKGHPLLLTPETLAGEAIAAEVDGFVARYRAYFDRQVLRGAKTMLAPTPGLAWVPGLGLLGIGANAAAARIAADIGCQTLQVMADGEAAGGFHPIGEADMFDCEYWSLEQAKLGRGKRPVFQGRIVLVTGGAGAIGLATARAFAALGATIFVVDLTDEAVCRAVKALGRDHGGVALDITAPGAAEAAVAACVARFGGLDILVSNAGTAVAGAVATLPDAVLRQAFELNFFAHFAFSQAATAVFRAQGRGGQILFNISKQAVNPGRISAPMVCPRPRPSSFCGNWRWNWGPRGSGSTASTPTASARVF